MAGDTDELERIECALPRCALGLEARDRVRADEHVFQHGHRREQLDVLEGAGNPQLDHAARRRVQQRMSVEQNVAGVDAVEPRDHVEGGRLARAVRADQTGDGALLHVERHVVQCDDAAEVQRGMLEGEEGHPKRS
jgi:hypothetical protein